jgi:HEAT repeat protein
MIALRRLPFLASLAVVLALPASGQDAQTTFKSGVDLLSRGQNEEALAAFQEVLRMDLSNADAYELWQSTNHEVWLQMLTAGGETELIGKRLMELASMGRKETENDEEAIRALLPDATSEDVPTRVRAVRQLATDHGEYAVPLMVFSLGDQADGDKRVLTMQALTHMGDDVVLPLIAALEAPDAYLRRNVALTLGYIGDPRACAALAKHAFSDTESPVRTASAEALERCGGTSDVAGQYLALGAAYYAEDDSVLRPHQVSAVVWKWDGNGLVGTDTPGFLYAPELAKRAFQEALAADPTSQQAVAGIVRCVVTQRGLLEEWVALGQDAGDWGTALEADELAVQLAGQEALDLALGYALETGDQIAAAGLCRALGQAATTETAGLNGALSHTSGAVRGEAGVALASIAVHNAGAVSDATVAALTEAAARDVLQIAAVIDGDEARRVSIGRALESRGLLVNSWPSGAHGLAALRTVPGVDVVLIADRLPDLTLDAVLYELSADPRTESTPVLVISSSADAEYGDGVAGVVRSAADVDTVESALEGGMNRDREQANELAARAARALWKLASRGADLSGTADALASTLASRPDDVVNASLGALGLVGGDAQVEAIAGVLSDSGRSEDVRVHAANALAGIFGRGAGGAPTSTVADIQGVATSEDSLAIRLAAARALARVDLPAEMRAELIRSVSGN